MISRCFLLLMLLVVGVLKSQAQKGFRIGPSAMFLSSRSSVIDSLPSRFYFRYKSGFNFGISAQYGFTPGFILATGVSFTSKGYRVFNDSNKNGTLLKHNVNNIEVPLNMIFIIKKNTSSNIRGLLGVSMNSVISKDRNEEMNKNKSFIIREEIKNKIYPMLNLGAELAYENKSSGNVLCVGIYYKQAFEHHTLLNVYNKQDATIPRFTLGFRGSYIGISVSYLFNLANFKKDEEFFY